MFRLEVTLKEYVYQLEDVGDNNVVHVHITKSIVFEKLCQCICIPVSVQMKQ